MALFGVMLGWWLVKIGFTVVVYYYTSDPKHMKEYEKQFLENYGAKTTQTVHLTLDDKDIELLKEVCLHKVKEEALAAKPPAKEIHYIDFKKEVHHPFRAEVIRCNDDLAMIGAFEPHCIFVLKKPLPFEFVYHVWIVKTKSFDWLDGAIFQFSEKFCYKLAEDEEISDLNESDISTSLPISDLIQASDDQKIFPEVVKYSSHREKLSDQLTSKDDHSRHQNTDM